MMKNETLKKITLAGMLIGTVAIVLTSLHLLNLIPFPTEPDVVCNGDAGMCPIPSVDSGVELYDVHIGDSGLLVVNGPKEQMPFGCVTAESYSYVYSHNHKNMSAHAQVKLDESMVSLEDIDLLAKITFQAWERKFDVDEQSDIDEYFDTVENLHVVYAGSENEFKEITHKHFNERTVATVMSNSYVCFETPGLSNQFVLVLSPPTYDKNMLLNPAVYIIHEMIHLASLALTGDIDKEHENTKLWIRHDNRRSVQAIAFRLYTEGR